ncbi:hypothetical protein D6789_00075 [Candidatus Woesearchaeota archaeon]|nr:MAG: hypothetical protein D6789_00075 [Candidatus Woesearchaeota archaeon]
MFDIRKVLVILVISVLYAAFVFSFVYAVYPTPKWDDYCAERAYPPPTKPVDEACPFNRAVQEQRQACLDEKGLPRDTYDDNGCVVSITCDPCQRDYEAAKDDYALIYFLITAILGAVSIVVALLLPARGTVNEWVGSGLLLGGVIVIFGGTIVTFGDLYTWLRPVVMLAELILVIYLAYRLWGKD